MSPSRIAAKHVGLPRSSSPQQARVGDRRPRRVAQLREAARRLTISHRSVRSSRPSTSKTSSSSTLQRVEQLARASPGSCRSPTSTRTTSPKRRRRSSSSTACEQVVGLVGDREVGVARDAERCRSRRSPCPGTARRGGGRSRPRAARRCARPRRSGTKRGSISFGTFTRANVSLRGDRVAQQHGEAQRQVGDVGERAPEADRERREHREDLAPEALGRAPARPSGADLVDARRSGSRARRARAQLALEAALQARAELA